MLQNVLTSEQISQKCIGMKVEEATQLINEMGFDSELLLDREMYKLFSINNHPEFCSITITPKYVNDKTAVISFNYNHLFGGLVAEKKYKKIKL